MTTSKNDENGTKQDILQFTVLPHSSAAIYSRQHTLILTKPRPLRWCFFWCPANWPHLAGCIQPMGAAVNHPLVGVVGVGWVACLEDNQSEHSLAMSPDPCLGSHRGGRDWCTGRTSAHSASRSTRQDTTVLWAQYGMLSSAVSYSVLLLNCIVRNMLFCY